MIEKLLRKKDVLDICAITNSTMYRKIGKGEFPRPIRLSDENVNAGVRWKESEIQAWIDLRCRSNEVIKNGVKTIG